LNLNIQLCGGQGAPKGSNNS